MSAHTCPFCHDTGEFNHDGMLDCTRCDAAVNRTAMNEFVRTIEREFATEGDIHWAIHQRATKLAEEAFMRKYEAMQIVVPAVEPSRRLRRSTDK